MIYYRYALTNFGDFLKGLAELLQTEVQEHSLLLPPKVGEGYLRAAILPNGLQALLLNFKLHQDLQIERVRTDKEFYVFICESARNVNRYHMRLDKEKISGQSESPSVMYLVSFLSDLQQFASAGTELNSLRVIMSREWLARYLQIDEMDEVLKRYLALRAGTIHIREMDFESKSLLNEIFQPSGPVHMEAAYLQNRIMMIIENFFTWMYRKMPELNVEINLSREDIRRISELESVLLSDLSAAPTINELSKRAAMSPSKFKKQFKDVYGLPVFEYFQKHRMQKARELLLSGNFTIREIGVELGYANLSNFSLAFKKEFQMLPSELLKNRAGLLK